MPIDEERDVITGLITRNSKRIRKQVLGSKGLVLEATGPSTQIVPPYGQRAHQATSAKYGVETASLQLQPTYLQS